MVVFVLTGDDYYKRIPRVKINKLNTFVESLVLAGFKPDDPTIKNILDALGEDDTLDVVIMATMTPEEFQSDVIDKFKNSKYESVDGERSLVLTNPGATLKSRVRLAHLLCIEAVTPSVPTVSEMARVTQRLTNLEQQPAPAFNVDTPPPSSTTVRKLKLKELVDQVHEEECDCMSEQQVLTCFARWESVLGPNIDNKSAIPVEAEPTAEQLSAVKHMIDLGINPYTDFGIVGSHGNRLLKKVKLTGSHWNGEGELVRVEINGPATYQLWKSSWEVYQNVLVMLDAVDLGKLVAYRKIIDNYYEQHGSSIWYLLYQTDVRTRAELFVRIKREGLADYQAKLSEATNWWGSAELAKDKFKHPYNPSRPWDYVFGRVMAQECQSTWWFKEMDVPILHNNKKRSLNEFVDGDVRAATLTSAQRRDSSAQDYTHPPPPKPPAAAKKARKQQPQDKAHNVVDGHHQTNRGNKQLCWGFNGGTCTGATGPGSCCPKNPERLHLCSKCLDSRHCALNCEKSPSAPSQRQGSGKGGKGGKGGGKNQRVQR